jgi:hypothetical protein
MKRRDKAEVLLACALLPPALEVMPASRIVRWLRGIRPVKGPRPDARRYADAVDRVLDRAPLLWKNTCLRRAVVLAALLRRAGRDAEVIIGVRRTGDGRVEAHAWLRCDGVEPYLEPQSVESFVRLTRA